MTETKSNGDALTAIRDLAELQKRLGNRMSPDDVLTVFDALDATEAELRKREKQIDAIGDGVVELARSWIEAIDEKVEESDSLRERAEKAERERDEARGMFADACKSLRDAQHTAAIVREREDANGGAAQIVSDVAYEMRQHWPDTAPSCLAEKVGDVVRELSARRASEAECFDTIAVLRTRVAALESEVKRLREALPSEDALNGAIASVVIVESVSRKTGNPMIEPARDWLTRLDAARTEAAGG